ncbi:T-complex protein 1 subunit delta [Perkinsus olseni]|uniref:T-complex protein 1 subunit delta n=1 Tax=Perkinsus olseni TaxID=32597 RepID=A0A7J6LNZ9_PEROL|nr:T-complex protein 1 subunit delta [Perkinsus olseni]KAF4660740.1 T-complex protein 1 subunit delta [Perkinsus olseni]
MSSSSTNGAAAAAPTQQTASNKGDIRLDNSKTRDVRASNIIAAKAVADAVRTSLGPRGMDKMIQEASGEVVITNDGATILKEMSVLHPTAKMLVELSKSQDIEAGDGTTSVVVIAGALLGAAQNLLSRGIHPNTISDGFLLAAQKAEAILDDMSIPISLDDRESLITSASTSLNSKVVAQSASLLAPMAVDAVMKVADLSEDHQQGGTVDLNDVRICRKLGGTIDDSELVDGLVMSQKIAKVAGGPTKIENAKIGLIQFCLSPPKTDMENNVTVNDYAQMDRILREERVQLAKMVKHIAKTGCNVLLVQKSILRDAVTNLSLDFCAKAKILVVRDVERDDVDFLSRILGCEPVASLKEFTKDKLGDAKLVREEPLGSGLGTVIRFTGLPKLNTSKCVSILLRGTNSLTLDEAERSLHDALCVVRSLVKKPAVLPGGGSVEMELSVRLSQWTRRELKGVEAYCVRAFAEALEIIPYTLAENAGLAPVEIVTQLRAAHADGARFAGIDVRKGKVEEDMAKNLKVLQPLLVSLSAIRGASETVRMIMKIDDLVYTR